MNLDRIILTNVEGEQGEIAKGKFNIQVGDVIQFDDKDDVFYKVVGVDCNIGFAPDVGGYVNTTKDIIVVEVDSLDLIREQTMQAAKYSV